MSLRDITEFSSPEKQEELTRLYGPTITSWDDVEIWDDLVIKEQKALISDFDSENAGKERCPYLKKLDNYFYFCEVRARVLEKSGFNFTSKPEVSSAQYNSHIDHFVLQVWCMRQEEDYKTCEAFRIAGFYKK
jgi:hypothetical protein